MASLQQIHSAKVMVANHSGCLGEADALVTTQAGLTVSVRTADCYPIFLADERKRAVAAVHAGWRGTVAHILDATIKAMQSRPEDIYAAIGPGIGVCCYQVGPEVGKLFALEQGGKVDLAAANRTQLLATGVPAAQISTLGGCTFCDAVQFHSFRRDKDQLGRMVSWIALQ